MALDDYIREQLDLLGLRLDSNKLKLLHAYVAELSRWSKVYNLTGSNSTEKLVDCLILDSALVVTHLEFVQRNFPSNNLSILDVGSGNGSPGIVWAIIKKILI